MGGTKIIKHDAVQSVYCFGAHVIILTIATCSMTCYYRKHSFAEM